MYAVWLSCKRWGLLALLGILLALFFYFDLYDYLNFSNIRAYQVSLQEWTLEHYYTAIIFYVLILIISIACTIPSASVLALIGGLLFGVPAIFYAILGTTLGGLTLFFAIRTSIGSHIAERTSGWIKIMERGFQENAFFYLLMLRLMPVCPCWISNISAGALNVPYRTFLAATVIGITPATIIYVMAGRGLDKVLSAGTPPSFNIIFTPAIFFPLLGLALLSIFPVLYKHLKKNQNIR